MVEDIEPENFSLKLSQTWTKTYTNFNKQVRPWQTVNINNFDYFMIVPFSKVFYVWNTLLSLTICYDTFTVPFSIALSFDIEGFWLVVDLFAILIYIVDIFMRARTAINK